MPKITKEVPIKTIKRVLKNALGNEFKISDEACPKHILEERIFLKKI